MDIILSSLNPATGEQLPIPLLIILGVVIVGCAAAGIIMKVLKNKKK